MPTYEKIPVEIEYPKPKIEHVSNNEGSYYRFVAANGQVITDENGNPDILDVKSLRSHSEISMEGLSILDNSHKLSLFFPS